MPLAEHDLDGCQIDDTKPVSIHVPLAEHDISLILATMREHVSIHVPLAEHDAISNCEARRILGFNSRAPRGARLHFG